MFDVTVVVIRNGLGDTILIPGGGLFALQLAPMPFGKA